MSERLNEEVWALDRCSGCGMCVATCAKGMLFWGKEEHPSLEVREKALGLSRVNLDSCSFCPKTCEEGCPQLKEWSPLEPKEMFSVRAKGVIVSPEPNEVIKSLLVASKAAGLIDGALLMDLNPWTLKPIVRIARTVEEMTSGLGMHYLWTPLFDRLNEAIYEDGLVNLALVGSPCVSQAVRKLRSSQSARLTPYREAIRLSIATFCTGMYRRELITQLLFQGKGIAPHQIQRLSVSPRDGYLTALLWDGSERKVTLNEAEQYTRRGGCATCSDLLGESADLAVGVLGAKEGHCTLITRSEAGTICLRNAVSFGLLESVEGIDEAALSRAAEEKDRRKRAQAFDQLKLLMLDALRDPQKWVEAQREFSRLYGTKETVETRKERVCHDSCAQC